MTVAESKLMWKLEIDGTDVTEWVVSGFDIKKTFASRPTPTRVSLDASCPYSFKAMDEWCFYIKVDSYVKVADGVVTEVQPNASNFTVQVGLDGYNHLFFQTDFSGRFRNDVGTGNKVQIIKDVVDEKFPDFTYDAISIPSTTEFFLAQGYINKKCNALITDIATSLNRVFWIGVGKVINVRERTFTQVDKPIVFKQNTIGALNIDEDTQSWGNIIRVIGKSFEVPVKETFSGSGTLDEFTLSQFPYAVNSVEYSSGTQISTALEGAENYDSGTEYDAYFLPTVPSLKFNINTDSGSDNIVINYSVQSVIYDERQDGTSIEFYNGRERVKTIPNENIEQLDDAKAIAIDELQRSAYIPKIYSISVIISEQDEIEKWGIGKNVSLQVNDEENGIDINGFFDIVEVNYRVSRRNKIETQLRLNNQNIKYVSVLDKFLARVQSREDRELASGEGIIKQYYWGGNFYFDVETVHIQNQDTDDGSFHVMREDIPWDDRSLMLEDSEIPDAISVYSGTDRFFGVETDTGTGDALNTYTNHGLESCREFNGSTSDIIINNTLSLLDGTKNFSGFMIINIDSSLSDGVLFHHKHGTARFSLSYLSEVLRFGYHNDSSWQSVKSIAVSKETTLKIRMVYDATTNTVDLVVNGVSATGSENPRTGSGVGFYIGRLPDGNSRYNGKIDDFVFVEGVVSSSSFESMEDGSYFITGDV